MAISSMSRWKNAPLRPFLAAAAWPGLGNPHSPHEVELMVSGAKPVAILGRQDINSHLQELIGNGSVIVINQKSKPVPGTIYCTKEGLKDAADMVRILNTTSEYEFFSNPPPSLFLTDENCLPNVENLESGSYRAIFGMANYPASYTEPFQQAAAENRILALDFNLVKTSIVIAQADRVEDGRELFARCFMDGEGYEKISPKEYDKRVGRLLGFTENDVAFYAHEKYHNPILRSLMKITEDVRRQARIKLMMMDAPRSSL